MYDMEEKCTKARMTVFPEKNLLIYTSSPWGWSLFEFFNDLGLAICLFNEGSKVKKENGDPKHWNIFQVSWKGWSWEEAYNK